MSLGALAAASALLLPGEKEAIAEGDRDQEEMSALVPAELLGQHTQGPV